MIALSAAVPHWKALVDREREAELVTRGWQYAEAIRVFQIRQSRLPNTLAELMEIEPRSIRQLWNDPLTGGPFLLVVEGPGGTLVTIDPVTGAVVADDPVSPDGGLDESEAEAGEGPAAAPSPGAGGAGNPKRGKKPPFGAQGATVAAPIHGVRSRATGQAYRVLFNSDDYGGWQFTVERLIAATGEFDPEGLPRRVDYVSIGKLFRYPPPGGIPGANPNVVPGKPPRNPTKKPPPANEPDEEPPPDGDEPESPDG